jgi:hypothetical protein
MLGAVENCASFADQEVTETKTGAPGYERVPHGCSTPGRARAANGGGKLPHST